MTKPTERAATRKLPRRIRCAAPWLLGLALCGCGEAALAPLPGQDARVTALAAAGARSFASYSHSCAIVDGGLQCWGAGASGQLGDGVLAARRPLPVRVGGLDGVEQVAAGPNHTCALSGGALYCWGRNDGRQLGRDGVSIGVSPEPMAGLPRPLTRFAAGAQHSCAVAGGATWCWGSSAAGALGSDPEGTCASIFRPLPCSGEPLRVEGLPGVPEELALGADHSCALVAGAVSCWGANDRGQLGDGSRESRSRPAPVEGLPQPVTRLAAGAEHSCAVAAGRVYCWGANDAGQLGDGTRADRPRPVAVAGSRGAVTGLTAGSRHGCAAAAGDVFCWGANSEGQLGGGDAQEAGPRRVVGLGGSATALAARADHSCAVIDAARVVCWGADDFGQLGRGRGTGSGPVQVGPWDRGGLRDVDRDGRMVVVCLGDSNTERSEQRPESWCDRLAGLLGPSWRSVNRGLGGATATPSSLRPASDQLEYALAHDAPDVLISAFGSNDLLRDVAATQIVSAYFAQGLRAAEAGVAFFVALTPPMMPPSHPLNPKIDELNALLRKTFPAERLIDFASGLTPSDFVDAIHLAASGQARRARAARDALQAAAAP